MEVLVAGCGAVGSVLAVALAAGGATVYCAVRSGGPCGRVVVRVEGFGEAEATACGWEGLAGRRFDAVLFAVKAYQFREALREALEAGVEGELWVSLQNGLGPLEMLEEAVGERAAGGLVFYGASRLPGWCCRSVLLGRGRVVLGARRLLPESVEQTLAMLADVLRAGGVEAEVVGDIEPYRWLKLAVNAAVNPVTVLAWAPNRVIVEDPDARRLAERLAGEVGAVARAHGITLPRDPVEAAFSTAKATGDNCSSMLQDVAFRGVSEVDYINGAVVGRAEAKGLQAPYNEAVWRSVRLLQRWLRGRGLPCRLSGG